MTTLDERLKIALSKDSEFSQAGLAKFCNVKPPSVSDWLSGKTKRLEGANLLAAAEYLQVNPWWLATGKGSPELQGDSKYTVPIEYNHGSDVLISEYETGGSMGKGIVLRDQPGIIKNIQVNKEWLERNVKKYSSVKNLAVVTGFGDSMKPLFNPGDPLLIDTGIKTVEYESVYFFRVGNDGYIKRLQRIPTEKGLIIRAKSENSRAYDPFDITEGMDFEVFAVVLKVWRSEDF